MPARDAGVAADEIDSIRFDLVAERASSVVGGTTTSACVSNATTLTDRRR